jgi:hypothetical protein
MRMDQGIRLQNLDPTHVKRSLLLGMLLTSVTFYILDDKNKPYPSCLTDPNFFYHCKNPCYYKQTCSSSIYEMFLPTLMFNIIISLGANNIFSIIIRFIENIKEQRYKQEITAQSLEQYVEKFERAEHTTNSAKLLMLLKEHGHIAIYSDGRECVAINKIYPRELPDNFISENGKTYVFLTPILLRAIKTAIQKRDHQPSLSLT